MDRAAISTTVTELPESRVRVLAEVPPEELRRAIDRSARALGRNLRVAGFRKGKVPPPVIIQRLGRETVVDRAVQDGLKHWWRVALDGAGIASVGQPTLDIVTPPTDDAPLTFSIEIGVRPTAELGPYKGLEVGRRAAEIEPGAVDAELEALRVRVARPQSVSRPAERGDLLVIDFNGLIDGEPFDGGRGRDQMVELGSGMLIAGFEEQLEGASTGELRNVIISFPNVEAPKDHRAEEVAGSVATFEVRVKDVLAKALPDLDDALAQDAAGCDTLEELREEIAAGLLAHDEERVAAEFGETVLDAVVAAATVDLPAALVGARAQEIWETTLRTLDFEGVSKEVYLQIAGTTEDEALTELRPQAAIELRRDAVVAAIAEAEGITVSEDDLRAHDARVLAEAEASGEEVAPPPQSRVTRVGQVLRERVLELLAREAVGISIADAQASGKPWPQEHAPELPELPEPDEPPQSGAASA
jgi:trigger factor